ncbi:hypothetical protein Tco_1021095 [Tanacetum coccineum]
MFLCRRRVVDCNNTQRELDEIFKTLKDVCEAYKLPLAQTWTISSKSSFVATGSNIEMTCSSFNSNCIGKLRVGFFLPVDMKEVADLQNLVHKVKLHLKLSSFVLGDVSTTDLIVLFSNNDLKNWNNGISNTEELYVNGVTRNKLDVVTKQRRKHKKDSVTREAIQQNFGKPIGEASKRLGGLSGGVVQVNVMGFQLSGGFVAATMLFVSKFHDVFEAHGSH